MGRSLRYLRKAVLIFACGSELSAGIGASHSVIADSTLASTKASCRSTLPSAADAAGSSDSFLGNPTGLLKTCERDKFAKKKKKEIVTGFFFFYVVF